MRWLYHPLLLLIAKSVQSDLAHQIEYLKAENAILRKRLPKRLILTAEEKRLVVKLGLAVGKGVQALLTVAAYPTFRRWVNLFDPGAAGTRPNRPHSKPGRPKTSDEVRDLVLRIARENEGWGYTRILGELRKLGIKTSRSNVVNILRQDGRDPKLDPTKGSWGEFLKAHAASLWQCDFFSKHIVTPEGIRQCFALAFVHVATRRVFVSPCTFKPDAAWMREQAIAFVAHAKEAGLPAELLLRDRDSKFTAAFDGPISAGGVQVKLVNYRSPNMNAYVERFVQSIQLECLDKFIAFGRDHMDLLTSEYVEHYLTERPHQSKENAPLVNQDDGSECASGEVVCRDRLGGVLRDYRRVAA
jgi:putative transposase